MKFKWREYKSDRDSTYTDGTEYAWKIELNKIQFTLHKTIHDTYILEYQPRKGRTDCECPRREKNFDTFYEVEGFIEGLMEHKCE